MTPTVGTSARIVADSVGPTGDRVTSFEIRFHRFTLAELNTHCVTGDTVLEFDTPAPQPHGSRRKLTMTVEEFVDKWQNGAAPRPNKRHTGTNRQPMRDRLAAMAIRQMDEETGLVITSRVIDARPMGEKPVLAIKTASGRSVRATGDHRFLTPLHGWIQAQDLRIGDELVRTRFGKRSQDLLDANRLRLIGGVWRAQWQREQRARLLTEHGGCTVCGSTERLAIHHIVPVHVDPSQAFDKDNIRLLCESCHHKEHHDQSVYSRGGTYLYGDPDPIVEIVAAGVEPVYDIEVQGPWHNFVANGLVVHNCVFARNSASSRAIPVAKQLERYQFDPAYPISWPAEQPGMAGGGELGGKDLRSAVHLFDQVHDVTGKLVRRYLDQHPEPATRLHKSVLNRLLEPMQWHTALVTASSYGNFFDQRVSPNAQPELHAVARLMKELYEAHTPTEVRAPGWHLPYVESGEVAAIADAGYDPRAISAARCARLSYLTQNGTRDLALDAELYTRLITNWHWSPLEHVCSPWPANVQQVHVVDPDTGELLGVRRLPRLGKFIGWRQWRHVEEARQGYESYR